MYYAVALMNIQHDSSLDILQSEFVSILIYSSSFSSPGVVLTVYKNITSHTVHKVLIVLLQRRIGFNEKTLSLAGIMCHKLDFHSTSR